MTYQERQLTRRDLLKLGGSTVTGFFLAGCVPSASAEVRPTDTPKPPSGASNVIGETVVKQKEISAAGVPPVVLAAETPKPEPALTPEVQIPSLESLKKEYDMKQCPPLGENYDIPEGFYYYPQKVNFFVVRGQVVEVNPEDNTVTFEAKGKTVTANFRYRRGKEESTYLTIVKQNPHDILRSLPLEPEEITRYQIGQIEDFRNRKGDRVIQEGRQVEVGIELRDPDQNPRINGKLPTPFEATYVNVFLN